MAKKSLSVHGTASGEPDDLRDALKRDLSSLPLKDRLAELNEEHAKYAGWSYVRGFCVGRDGRRVGP